MATIEIVPPPRRALELQDEMQDIAIELEDLGHDAYTKSEKGFHLDPFLILRVVETSMEMKRLVEQIHGVLDRLRQRRKAAALPRERVQVYGPNGKDVLLDVEI